MNISGLVSDFTVHSSTGKTARVYTWPGLSDRPVARIAPVKRENPESYYIARAPEELRERIISEYSLAKNSTYTDRGTVASYITSYQPGMLFSSLA